MKQLLKFIIWALVASCIIYLTSCSRKINAFYVVKGTVTDVKNKVVILDNGWKFKVKKLPTIGDTVTFTATDSRRVINSKSVN